MTKRRLNCCKAWKIDYHDRVNSFLENIDSFWRFTFLFSNETLYRQDIERRLWKWKNESIFKVEERSWDQDLGCTRYTSGKVSDIKFFSRFHGKLATESYLRYTDRQERKINDKFICFVKLGEIKGKARIGVRKQRDFEKRNVFYI